MDTIVSSYQTTFIKGENLVDEVVVVNELIEFAKKSKRGCLILKVNFQKAYKLTNS